MTNDKINKFFNNVIVENMNAEDDEDALKALPSKDMELVIKALKNGVVTRYDINMPNAEHGESQTYFHITTPWIMQNQSEIEVITINIEVAVDERHNDETDGDFLVNLTINLYHTSGEKMRYIKQTLYGPNVDSIIIKSQEAGEKWNQDGIEDEVIGADLVKVEKTQRQKNIDEVTIKIIDFNSNHKYWSLEIDNNQSDRIRIVSNKSRTWMDADTRGQATKELGLANKEAEEIEKLLELTENK